jgi:hypothetical protein
VRGASDGHIKDEKSREEWRWKLKSMDVGWWVEGN